MFDTDSQPDEVRTRPPATLPKQEEKDRAPLLLPASPRRAPLTTTPATAPHTR